MLNPKHGRQKHQLAFQVVGLITLLGYFGCMVAIGRPETLIGKIFTALFALPMAAISIVPGIPAVMKGISLMRHSFQHRLRAERPPISATFLLYLFLSKDDRETLPGDLEEEFKAIILPKFGLFRAWLWYWVQALAAIAYRNALCRWLLVGGGILKLGEWVTHRLRG